MSDQTENLIIQRARARRRELEEEIQKLNTFLEVYQKLEGNATLAANANVVFAAGTDQPESTPKTEAPIKERATIGRKASGMSQIDFTKFVRDILIERGQPLEPEEIFKEIHDRGRKIGGEQEWENFKTKLWRAKKKEDLALIPGAGYWPNDIPCPAVGYTP